MVIVKPDVSELKELNDVDPTLSPADTNILKYDSGDTRFEAAEIGAGTGDVTGPGVAVDENITVFNSTTGKIIKDSGVNISDVTANTSARHTAVTVTDTTEIDLTLTGQDIQADIKSGSIDVLKLDSGVQTSLGLADSATQPLDNISTLTNDSGFTDKEGTVTSVAVTGSDGVEVDSGSPITTSGTIALGVNKTTMLSTLNVADGAEVNTVDSVNTKTGAVVLDPDDLDDTSTTNKFVTAADITVLGNTSNTNTGDNTTMTNFDGTAYRVFYTDVSGNVTELALGASGTFLQSNGAAAAPTFAVPAGSGDVSKVGTPVDSQVGVWTGDGTIEGTANFTYDGSNLQLTGDIGSTGTRITKGWFTDLQVTNDIAGDITGNAATVTSFTPASGSLTLSGDDAVTITTTAATNVTLPTSGTLIANVVDDTTPQLGGDLDWNSNGMKVVSQTVGGSNGDIVYLSSANTWSQADASADTTSKGLLGIRISATEVLTHGLYTTSGLTAGSIYYISETGGAITTTAPSTSTSIVRIIGYALSTTELFVNPDKTYIEVA